MMKTDTIANIGKHAFELAGLGLAPFRFTGTSDNLITYPDGSCKPGGSCDYCGTGIRLECHCVSSDGKAFKVGCDCIAKVGDAGLLKAYKSSPEYRQRMAKARADKAARVSGELTSLLAANESGLKAIAHPYGYSDRKTGIPLTYWDYVQYSLGHCGMAGRASWLKTLKTRLATNKA